MIKKIMSLMLCVSLMLSFVLPNIFSITTISASELPSVAILYKETEITSITVAENERKKITASCSTDDSSYEYQWQICSDSNSWVNINNENGKCLELSYALTMSMLDNGAGTYVRCKVFSDDVKVYSEPISVTIVYNVPDYSQIEISIPSAPHKSIKALGKAADNEIMPLDDGEYVTITINYLDGVSKDQLFSPYTATIEKGTDFLNQKVISPTFLGYAPYYNSGNPSSEDSSAATDSAAALILNYSDVNQNITINIYYRAIDVPFAARYFFQNIYNDQYTENVALYKTGTAKTGTIVADDLLTDGISAEGFTKLYHYPEAVAADGSTVFECYYDRNYYLIKFDMNGGYGVDPIYARYDTPFAVHNPTKHGYVFKGWDKLDADGNGDGLADAIPGTIPAENQTYRALWGTENTTYTVAYWKQNSDDDNYSYWGSETKNAKSNDQVSGEEISADHASILGLSDFRYFEFEKADENITVEGDGSTVVNVYYKRKVYKLKYYYAMSSGTGSSTKYYVIGGSTYRFGSSSTITETDKGDEVKLLDHYMDSYASQRGQVDELPTLNDKGIARNYNQGYDTSTVNGTEYTYYYIEFDARYGAAISDLWPCDVFNSVTRVGKNNANGWSGTEAFVSAWNGEHHVYYSQHNSNQTIKGNYNHLDSKLLWDYDQFGDNDTVAYLCFWENGANVNWSVPELYRYNVYLPVRDGQSIDGVTTKVYKGITYYLMETYDTCDDSNVNQQTPPPVDGFTYSSFDFSRITDFDRSLYREAYDVNFYYTRNTYQLEFHNYGTTVKSETVPYQTSLTNTYFIPEYPDTLEKNAYEFAGWYTSPGCYDGTEVKWDDLTMPASDMMLYAKWMPVDHKVMFFKTYDAMLEYENSSDKEAVLQELKESGFYLDEREVSHGSFIGSIDNPPALIEGDIEYSFAGWFYMINGEKKAFTPLDMPITSDMYVFADWGSHSPQPYTIHYALDKAETNADTIALLNEQAGGMPRENVRYTLSDLDGESSYVYLNGTYHLCVADDTTGYGYQGSTRTFAAKAGNPYNQLYGDYNNGYFPTLASHSITMKYEEDKTHAVNNVFTFTYINADNIKYTVKYVDKNTGKELADSVVKYTSDSVVTERFHPISDYLPDSFYKRLLISVKEDPDDPGSYIGSESNEIIFYYTKNENSSFYAVHFMLQKAGSVGTDYKIDGTGDYYENDTHIEGIADINEEISITPLTFSGFSAVSDPAYIKVNGTETPITATDGKFNIEINQSGTELYIFYTRENIDYKVYYLKYGTDISDLSTLEKTDADKGVLKDAKIVENQDYDSTVSETAAVIDGYNCVSPLIQTITILHEAMHNRIIFYYSPLQYTAEYRVWNCGGGTLTKTSETIDGDDELEGSEAKASSGYRFDGWYLDEECTIPAADKGSVANNKFVPDKSKLAPSPDTNIFYAKFVPQFGSITINRINTENEANGEQAYVYKIINDSSGDAIYVTVSGSSSVTITDLLYGSYTVEQMNDWSWRYNDEPQIVELNSENSEVYFSDKAVKEQWLSGNSDVEVNKRGGTEK